MRRLVINVPAEILKPILKLLDHLTSLGDLIARFWVAKIFFMSGISKLYDWNTTLVLFKYEYSVPFFSPAVAAYMGTFAELFLPMVLILGFGGRFFIFAFFVYNIICVASYHFLWTPAGSSGFQDHVTWGILLMMLMFHGSGKYSLDYVIHKRWGYIFHSLPKKHHHLF